MKHFRRQNWRTKNKKVRIMHTFVDIVFFMLQNPRTVLIFVILL
jgi:hypothetical protein